MKYTSVDEVAEIVKDKSKVAGKDYIIVDVRDNDFVGGHIKGVLHQPSVEFPDNVDSLVSKTKDVPLVIFHCYLSKMRAVNAATSYEQLRHQKVDKDVDHEVVIMRGGFSEFQGKFKDDGEIVEDWDKNVWGT